MSCANVILKYSPIRKLCRDANGATLFTCIFCCFASYKAEGISKQEDTNRMISDQVKNHLVLGFVQSAVPIISTDYVIQMWFLFHFKKRSDQTQQSVPSNQVHSTLVKWAWDACGLKNTLSCEKKILALCFIDVTQINLPRKKAWPYFFKIHGFLLLEKSEYCKESEIANNKVYYKLRNLLKMDTLYSSNLFRPQVTQALW